MVITDKWIKVNGNKVICSHNELFDFPGVYVVYANENVIYVGQSSIPRIRFFHHKIYKKDGQFITSWGNFFDFYIKIKYPKNYGKESMIEKRLIYKLRPKFNRQNLKYLKHKNIF